MNQHPFVIGSSILLVAALVFFAGAWVFVRPPTMSLPISSGPGVSTTTQGLPSAKSLPPGTPNPADKFAYTHQYDYNTPTVGIVKSVGTNSFVMSPEMPAPMGSKPTGQFGDPLTINITSKTEIFMQGEIKDAAAYQKEMDAFVQAISYGTDKTRVYIAPDRFVHIPLKLSDIKPGAAVYMTSNEAPKNGQLTPMTIQVRYNN